MGLKEIWGRLYSEKVSLGRSCLVGGGGVPFELHGECVHMCVCVWFATLGILRVGQDGILSQRRCAASRRENDRERVLAEERAFTNWVILDGLPLSLSLFLSLPSPKI